VRPDRWTLAERKAFGDLALVLDLVPDLSRWRIEERDDLAGIIRVKAGTGEIRYLKGLQRHVRLRQVMIRLGSDRGTGDLRG
jgi:hypothetical protein